MDTFFFWLWNSHLLLESLPISSSGHLTLLNDTFSRLLKRARSRDTLSRAVPHAYPHGTGSRHISARSWAPGTTRLLSVHTSCLHCRYRYWLLLSSCKENKSSPPPPLCRLFMHRSLLTLSPFLWNNQQYNLLPSAHYRLCTSAGSASRHISLSSYTISPPLARC